MRKFFRNIKEFVSALFSLIGFKVLEGSKPKKDE